MKKINDLFGINFLFAKHKIMEAGGVVQHIGYVVNPTIKKVVKGLVFPESGELQLFAKDEKRPSRFELIYEGPAISEFMQCLISDAFASEDNPRMLSTYCCVEEYGIGRETRSEAKREILTIEVVEKTKVAKFVKARDLKDADKPDDIKHKHGAMYKLIYEDGLAVEIEIYTADDPARLEEIAINDFDVAVGGVEIPLSHPVLFKAMRLYRKGVFDRDELGAAGL